MTKKSKKKASKKTQSRSTPPLPPAQQGQLEEEMELTDPTPGAGNSVADTGVVAEPEVAETGLADEPQQEELEIDTTPEEVTVLARKDLKRMVHGGTVYSFQKGKIYKVPAEVASNLFLAGYA